MSDSDIGPHRLVPAEELKAIVRAMCRAKGSSEAEAAQVADNLIEANLTGHDSHGIGMMPTYVESFLKGILKLNQTVRVVNDLGAVLVLDAQHGYGQAIGIQAMDLGMERARKHGVCLVATRNSHHLGRIGAWAEHCARKGFASMHFVNVLSRPAVAPFGGRDGRFSTNPFCAAVPRANGEHIVLDMATSKVALGKMRVAVRRGKAAPHESVLDARGEPTDDPNVMYQRPSGAMLPFGEHKGSGLALICELFAGALGGGGTIASVGGGEGTPVNGMLSVVIRPDALDAPDRFGAGVEELYGWVKASPPRDPENPVLVAGEPERRNKAARLAKGVPVEEATWAELIASGRKVNIDIEQFAPGARKMG
jgi:hydroxycarboxylate dehydrogenase B